MPPTSPPVTEALRDPTATAVRRAAMRIASALMQGDAGPLGIGLAVQIGDAVAQADRRTSLVWLSQQVGNIGWRLGNHPLVAAARPLAGRPPSVDDPGDDNDDDSDGEPRDEAWCGRAADLAGRLRAENLQSELRHQALDRRLAAHRFPAHAEASPDAAVLMAHSARLVRTCRAALPPAVRVRVDAHSRRFQAQKRLLAPTRVAIAFGPALLITNSVDGQDLGEEDRDTLDRLGLAFSLLTLVSTGLELWTSNPTHCATSARGALNEAVAEVSIALGRRKATSGDGWLPAPVPGGAAD